MRLTLAAFTGEGVSLAKTIASALGEDCRIYAPPRWAEAAGVLPMETPLAQWAAGEFPLCDGLIFVGATGIAVRAIAPLLQDKTVDPAVVVVDTAGQYAISLLSGHLGGANDLARRVARSTGGTAVITTATDTQGAFAADSWADKRGFTIMEPHRIKAVSAALLAGEEVGLSTLYTVTTPLPQGLALGEGQPVGVLLSHKIPAEGKEPFAATLHLVPKSLVLGIGCRRGVPGERIETAVRQVLASHGLTFEAVGEVGTITLKEDEDGLWCFAEKYGLGLHFYTPEALAAAPGTFTASGFVAATTGVDNVCERAAVLLGGGPLLVGKTVVNGVTVAVATRPQEIDFS